MMDLVQKVKVNLAMMNSTFNQMKQIVMKMKKEMPSVSCNPQQALKIINGILSATKIVDIIKYREEARKMGGLDKVVKCLFKDAMEKTIAEFEKLSKEIQKELKEYKAILKKYEESVSLLSVR